MTRQPGPSLLKRWLPLLAFVLLAAALPLSPAAAQAPAPKATTFLSVSHKGVDTPGARFDLVQSVIDLGPGATFTVASTTAAHYLAAAEGALSVDLDGTVESVAAGKGIAAPAGSTLTVSNASTTAKARLFVSSLLELGAVAAVHQPSGAGVSGVTTSRLTMSGAPAKVDVSQGGVRYDVGFTTPNHIMNQPHLQTIVGGQCTYKYLDNGQVETYGPGAQVEMYVGRPGNMGTAGSTPCSFLVTWVATPGKPLTSAVPAATTPAPAPPRTGTGIAQDRPVSSALAATGLVLVVLGASALAAVGSRRTPQAR
ncbi:MAG: hypothetical protein IH609_16465 [Dehalococcoidia bacterium]|nr:hypothetical protein [Dehalococcoidia bacterium]